MRIALAGNPNSGKTTMYNALTGQNEKVGNWAGVTVDKKEHTIKKNYYKGEKELIAVDLPGAYSMSPFTSEESVTRDYVNNQKPDVIINIVDSTNLGRSLFFTTQLLELGIPIVVALNKSDVNEKKETRIKAETFNFTSNFTTDNTRKGLIHIDEKGNTKVRYYKTVKDNDYTYIYFDFKNSDYQANKEIVIKTMYINDKLYNMQSFKEVIYRGSERDVYIKIPRKKINNVKNIRISFYIIERAPDNSINKLYITNEYSKNV
jgi:Fe2+ transport system protein B